MDQSNEKNYLQGEKEFFASIEGHFAKSGAPFSEKMHAFPRFTPRQSLSYFLARQEIFRNIVNLHGTVMDFGVYRGSSFFTWLQLSAILEPYNHIRRVVGFDSFKGFSELAPQDKGASAPLKFEGGMALQPGAKELEESIKLYDLNRPLGHVKRAVVIENDVVKGLSGYLSDHPETVVALANFGLGLYRPTVELLKLIKGRLQTGSVLVFEEINQETWPGETMALLETFELLNIRLQRLPYCPHISYMIVEGKKQS